MFRVGQKVVCVDDSATWRGVPAGLLLNAIYTVERAWDNPDGPAVSLVEIADWADAHHRYGFRASRFRPAVERKTDISIFKRMLTDTRETV